MTDESGIEKQTRLPRSNAPLMQLLLPYAWLLFMVYQLTSSVVLDAPKNNDWEHLWSFQNRLEQLRDWFENFLLALPAGVLFTFCNLDKARGFGGFLIRAYLPILIVAVGMELAQWWMPARTASMWDAVSMMLGAVVGGVIGSVAYRRITIEGLSLEWTGKSGVMRVLSIIWVATAWIPTNLQLEADGIRRSLAPLYSVAEFSITTLISTSICWIAAAVLYRARTALVAAMLSVAWLGLLISPGRALVWDEVLGGLLALALWPAIRYLKRPKPIVLLALAIATCLKLFGAAPTHTIAIGATEFFSDHTLVGGSWLVALVLLIQHYFALVAFVLLFADSVSRDRFFSLVVPICGLCLLAVEIIRHILGIGVFRPSVWVVFGTAILVVLTWYRKEQSPARTEPATRKQFQSEQMLRKGWMANTHSGFHICLTLLVSHFRSNQENWRKFAVRGLMAGMAIAAVLGVVLYLPQVPYNLRELFHTRFLLIGIPLFTGFLLWSAAAPNLIARITLLCPVLHVFQPLLFLVFAIPSWLLIRYSVSAESLWDILGTPILGWPGDWELFFRFLAFSAPFFVWLFAWNLFFGGIARLSVSFGFGNFLAALGLGSPFLLAAKWIIVDYAATDNIRELIFDTPAWWGLCAVFGLLGVICLNGVMLAWAIGSRLSFLVTAGMVTPVLWLCAWWLLNQGLLPEAVEFLLKPDRNSTVTELELLVRWTISYAGAIALIALSNWLVLVHRSVSIIAHEVIDRIEPIQMKNTPFKGFAMFGSRFIGVALLLLSVAAVLDYPIYPWFFLGALTVYSGVLILNEYLAFFFLPILLSCVDFSAWSGRFIVEIPDIFIIASLGIFLLNPGWNLHNRFATTRTFMIGILLLLISVAVSTTISLHPWASPTANSFVDYLDPFNALRVLKGFLFPILLLPLLHSALNDFEKLSRYFLFGMTVALAIVSVVVVLQRWRYTGIWNFDSELRIVGTFASMHIGGGHLGAFITMALPATMLVFWREPSIWRRMIVGCILIIAIYSLLVSFARSAWSGSIIALGVVFFFILHTQRNQTHDARYGWLGLLSATSVVLLALGLLIYPFGQGEFTQYRLSRIPTDLQNRLKIAEEAIEIMDPGLVPALLGMGLGSFPRLYYERNRHGTKPSRCLILYDGDNPFLRSIGGQRGQYPEEGLFLFGQRLFIEPFHTYRLRLKARSPNRSGLSFQIHEKTILYSKGGIELTDMPTFTPQWEVYEVTFNSGTLGKGFWLARRGVMFFFFNWGAGAVVDLDDISLFDESGRNLIRNGDFQQKHDFWTFEVKHHTAFQIKNAYVSTYFEQGLLGVAALFLIVTGALSSIGIAHRRAPNLAAALAAGVVGFLVVGLTDNLTASSHLTTLFLSMLILLAFLGSPRKIAS